ncbi:MAG: nicotinate (nicotinamide) nucleotide adenylyltransferase [Betaproteobacteria bacterium]|nr:nicotinate (nicotinamide) nucleotide adenylyltransferase [Betaproteobacteria bacterium]
MSPRRRIGVFGGAFDPPHLAHVALVRSAIEALGLEQVWVQPTGEARHRRAALSDAAHRLAMTRLAFAELPQVVVDAREIARSGPSYTVDTLREMAAENPDAQLYLLMGDDQRRSLPAWHRIGEIARLAIICAAARDPQVASWHTGEPSGAELPGPDILPLPMPLMPISATDIRERLSHQCGVAGLLAPAVERYIHEHHLYSPR